MKCQLNLVHGAVSAVRYTETSHALTVSRLIVSAVRVINQVVVVEHGREQESSFLLVIVSFAKSV